MNLKKIFAGNGAYSIAIMLGIVTGLCNLDSLNFAADKISEVFINLLKLVSLPIIFLSLLSTSSGMESVAEIKLLGRKTVKYTLLTTVLAATIALLLFLVIDPVRTSVVSDQPVNLGIEKTSYLDHLIHSIPSNILTPFIENNVIGVMFISIFLSLAVLSLPNEKRKLLHDVFSSLFAAIMKLTSWIVRIMPIAIWAFVTLFIRDLQKGLEFKSLALYLLVVVLANLVQAFVVLPILLKAKGIPPAKMAKGMLPALSVAFFTKSSNATLPMAIRCAEERVGISRKVAGFTLPLCTSINMNGCAAFILTTVLFVSMSYGMTYTPFDLIMWVGIATIAAVGNAGVPMGCYFLSSALLASMNMPLHILGVILPFYTLIDMLETAINVWSDSCVAAVVESDTNQHPVLVNTQAGENLIIESV